MFSADCIGLVVQQIHGDVPDLFHGPLWRRPEVQLHNLLAGILLPPLQNQSVSLVKLDLSENNFLGRFPVFEMALAAPQHRGSDWRFFVADGNLEWLQLPQPRSRTLGVVGGLGAAVLDLRNNYIHADPTQSVGLKLRSSHGRQPTQYHPTSLSNLRWLNVFTVAPTIWGGYRALPAVSKGPNGWFSDRPLLFIWK